MVMEVHICGSSHLRMEVEDAQRTQYEDSLETLAFLRLATLGEPPFGDYRQRALGGYVSSFEEEFLLLDLKCQEEVLADDWYICDL